ncbi:PQQ-dependent dehydrogenase, methanol/ethanol family [Mangrovimicrobium sediminis]|uniref:PQQ-dependent dehydrogenase, methanol/ethanol family n=1 Tax=Mangrovimicrobium sediminis TaxID=2562682 RepID=A0A4Z0LXB9_9GAMM|nr:PQQ-dependent dehydrogenase, methanol/ethanol family [Haliea sp. SAOS-164]TGD71798.1 PQQ-dependent dehydrogenase, methanol/ethanol family [Haliea sp. SAOS-164]
MSKICRPLLIAAAAAVLGACSAPPVTTGAASADVDWPGYNNGADESGYSPLEQINRDTLDDLGLAWTLDLPGENTLEARPIAVDGVLYFTGSTADVYAVDARSGKLLWKHAAEVWKHNPRKMKFIFPINRGCAYDNGRIFSATTDGRLLALDAKSGELLWSTQTLDPASPETITGAPRTFDGKVMIGHGGGDIGVRGHVAAYDQVTGEEVWKFYVVPGSPEQNAGDPAMERAATTWTGEYWKTGTGGAPWDSLTYDPELDQVYIGTGNSGPYDPEKRSPGGGDNLYLTSIVALDADSGEYRWHYQQNPREAWDYKSTANMVAANLEIDGRERKVLMQLPTNGFYYVLDRVTGKPIAAEKVGKVTWAERIDLETGRPVEKPGIRYQSGEAVLWPSVIGAHNWMPMAWSPQTELAYIPYMQLGMRFIKSPANFTGVEREAVLEDERDGKGSLVAWDPVAGEEAWRVDHDWLWNGGLLATAGGLVFQGTADGWFSAYDAADGERLWRFNAGLGMISAASSYSVDGVQYIAILAGYGVPNLDHMPTKNPGWRYGAQPRRLLVFRLGGDAQLPPTAPPSWERNIIDDPELVIDPADVAAGQLLFGSCRNCHGAGAISYGAPAPDLRESALAMDLEALYSALQQGTFTPRGMPSFDELSREQVRQIHAFIRDRARAALAGEEAATTKSSAGS